MNEVQRNRIHLKNVLRKIALNHYERGDLSEAWMDENFKTLAEYRAMLAAA